MTYSYSNGNYDTTDSFIYLMLKLMTKIIPLQIDFAITTLTNMLTERQKKFVKYAEQLGKVQEISSNLQKCQSGLKDVIKSMEMLNDMLPPEERLEPFVMVTG